MEIVLDRVYLPNGTHGKLNFSGEPICETIERPWRNNKRYISCVPEGRYQLIKRQHHGHGTQLGLSLVPNREPILIHPARFSLSELQGCIAPVTKATDDHRLIYCRIAYERLTNLVLPLLDAGEKVDLLIRSV